MHVHRSTRTCLRILACALIAIDRQHECHAATLIIVVRTCFHGCTWPTAHDSCFTNARIKVKFTEFQEDVHDEWVDVFDKRLIEIKTQPAPE